MRVGIMGQIRSADSVLTVMQLRSGWPSGQFGPQPPGLAHRGWCKQLERKLTQL